MSVHTFGIVLGNVSFYLNEDDLPVMCLRCQVIVLVARDESIPLKFLFSNGFEVIVSSTSKKLENGEATLKD